MNHSIICQLYHMASFEFNLLQEIHKGSLKNKSTKKNILPPLQMQMRIRNPITFKKQKLNVDKCQINKIN